MSKNENKKANALTDEDLGQIAGGGTWGCGYFEATPEDQKAYDDYRKNGLEAQKRGANLYVGDFNYWENNVKNKNINY